MIDENATSDQDVPVKCIRFHSDKGTGEINPIAMERMHGGLERLQAASLETAADSASAVYEMALLS